MSVLSATTQKLVEEDLIGQGLTTAEELEQVRRKAVDKSSSVLGTMVSENIISDEQLTRTIAKISNVPYVNLSNARVDADVLTLLPQEIAQRYMAVPLGEMQHRLVVAMLDADNVQAADFLSNKIGRPLKIYAASETGIKRILKQYSERLESNIAGALQTTSDIAQANDKATKNEAAQKMSALVQDSPISKALTTIMDYAAKNRASDIHIEPLEKSLRIRVRVDGVMREIMKLPKSTEAPLVSRVKILSNLKIDEHRIPQDGGFSIMVDKRAIDLRIAISPVVWGEQIVIRLLDKTGTSLKLEDMGYTGRALRTVREGLKQPNGMVLTSGPTGSGKSTSMYAALQEIKNDSINIVTLEDPVEYKMDGINQIQVNADVGLTFATGLRSILRQDPNVVMVGEIRDKETAQLAVQAALTGHLVFSTLHTNSASGILPRLLDMGIEPFLIASTVHTVIGQRLVRRISDDREAYQSDPAQTAAIKSTLHNILPATKEEQRAVSMDHGYQNLPLLTQNAYTLYKGKDNPDTPGGYKGRMGLYEVFNISDTIQSLILKRSTSSEIQKAAQAEGMITMREDGYLKALAGFTTLDEVNRVAALDSA